MKQELIKQAFKLGNSAGILLPVEWQNRKVVVKLVDRSISQEIMEILEEKKLLKNVMGVYLAGSYARGEETEESDIDILIITDNIDKQIKIGKYEIFIISKDKFEKSILKSIYLASLINESKTILNNSLLEICKKNIENISIEHQLRDIESITKINKMNVGWDEEEGEKVSDGTIYSIVLRLRELYLIECLRSKKLPTKKEFIKLIKIITNEECYNGYLRIKNDLKPKKVILPKNALVLIEEIERRIKKLKQDDKKKH